MKEHSVMIDQCRAIVFAVAFLLCGCANPVLRKDVTNQTKYQIGYAPGQVYRLTTDVALVRYSTENGRKSVLCPHPEGGHVWSLEKPDVCFIAPVGKYDEIAIGTVPAGSRIRIERLEHQTYLLLSDYERYVVAYAQLLDSPFVGMTVGLSRVSEPVYAFDLQKYLIVQAPRESLLHRVEQ